jgi:hypothetical protein
VSASFTCPRCGRTSRHPIDAREGYCGYCHDWTRPPWAVKVSLWYRFPGDSTLALFDETVLGFDDDPALLDDLARAHAHFVDVMAPANYRPGRAPVYSIDFEFADGEHYRFGTDRDVMVQPIDVAPADFLARLEQLMRQRHPG